MADVGILDPDERVELIEGEIVQMAPIGPRDAGCVINANRLLLLRPRVVSYSVSVHPMRTSCSRSRWPTRRSGFWLCLAVDGAVEVYRAPAGDGYTSVTLYGPGQTVSPLAFPDVSFAVTDFFA